MIRNVWSLGQVILLCFVFGIKKLFAGGILRVLLMTIWNNFEILFFTRLGIIYFDFHKKVLFEKSRVYFSLSRTKHI